MSDLEPLAPAEGVAMYLDDRRDELSKATRRSHRYRLEAFVDWCDLEGIENLNDLSGRDLHNYKVYRREEDGLKPVSLQGQISTIRKFVEFCESIEAVERDLKDRIILPSTSKDEDSSDVTLEPERAMAILDFLGRFEYASRDHALFAFATHTSARLGGLRAPDLEDYDRDARCVEIRHRPETDTPLKNGEDGERDVSLSEGMCEVLDDYIEFRREDVEDVHGRRPLFTTENGRMARSTVRNAFYRWTRPCEIGDECPHDRDPQTCEATNYAQAYGCPSSVSPHPTRRGSITQYRKTDMPADLVGERVNATPDVIEKHYDRRSKRERMEKRRRYLEDDR